MVATSDRYRVGGVRHRAKQTGWVPQDDLPHRPTVADHHLGADSQVFPVLVRRTKPMIQLRALKGDHVHGAAARQSMSSSGGRH